LAELSRNPPICRADSVKGLQDEQDSANPFFHLIAVFALDEILNIQYILSSCLKNPMCHRSAGRPLRLNNDVMALSR